MILVIIADHYFVFAMLFMQLRGKAWIPSYLEVTPETGNSGIEGVEKLQNYAIF